MWVCVHVVENTFTISKITSTRVFVRDIFLL